MISREAYNISREYEGLKEVDGPDNNPIIELAHKVCHISQTGDVDSSIPWCSSWVNLCVLAACCRINPQEAYVQLSKKYELNTDTVRRIFELAKVHTSMIGINTKKKIELPTFSAASKSWDTWGEYVPVEKAQRGDILRLSRDGGGHVCFLDEDTVGLVMMKVMGGNQSNKVCSSSGYARARLLHVRRSLQ